jgi:hypothetical protein
MIVGVIGLLISLFAASLWRDRAAGGTTVVREREVL